MKKAASKARPTMTRMTRSMVPSLVVNMALSCADGDAGNTLAARGSDRIDLEQMPGRWPVGPGPGHGPAPASPRAFGALAGHGGKRLSPQRTGKKRRKPLRTIGICGARLERPPFRGDDPVVRRGARPSLRTAVVRPVVSIHA